MYDLMRGFMLSAQKKDKTYPKFFQDMLNSKVEDNILEDI